MPAGERAALALDLEGSVRIAGESIDLGPYESTSTRVTVLYVDAVNGDDENSGLSADAPKRTLAATFARMSSLGITVRVEPGRYDSGAMSEVDGDYGEQLARVIVPNGVTLESTGGADMTFIVGAASTNSPSDDCLGNGPGAVRCVALRGADCVVRGFTMVDGHVTCNSSSAGYYGGGIYGNGLAEDCVFLNCSAVRGGGVSRTTCRRCTFRGCTSSHYGVAAMSCEGLYNCLFMDCTNGSYITMYARPVVNCTFMPGAQAAKTAVNYASEDDSPSNVVNCVLFTNTRVAANYLNCAFVSNCNMTDACKGAGSFIVPVGSSPTEEESLAAVGMNADGTLTKGSALVDTGTNGLYFSSIGAKDVSGGQRIYNRTIDMGAYEYDWRGEFAEALSHSRRFTVVEATSNVTKDAGGIAFSDGDTVSMEWTWSNGSSRDVSFEVSVSGEGVFSYSFGGGEPVAVDCTGGKTAVVLKSVTSPMNLKMEFSGSGTALVSSFIRSDNGMKLVVR